MSKRKQNRATGGYLGWRRGSATSSGSVVVAVEGLRWPARLLLLLALPPLFFSFLFFSFFLSRFSPLLCSLILRSPFFSFFGPLS